MSESSMKKEYPRIVLGALKSGSGKTTVTCALLRALLRRGIKVGSMKCGPDYIDPMFHRQVLGIPSGNIDTFFTEEVSGRYLFADHCDTYDLDLCVLEGVMGYYDGLGGESDKGSTYEVAVTLDAPVVLVVDAKGASLSLAAVISGMLSFRENHHVKGVILNRCSPSYYDRIKNVIEENCKVPVLGFFPDLKDKTLPSRHLGLLSPEEIAGFHEWTDEIADVAEQFLDIDAMIALANSAPFFEKVQSECDEARSDCDNFSIDFHKNHVSESKLMGVHLAVARDEAFSFYYEENLRALKRLGCEVTYFSPIHDEQIPEETDALLLGGGYPELYAKELSENTSMIASIRRALENRIPFLAECGGFLYLQKDLQTAEGETYPMVGFFEGTGIPKGKLTRFGYIEVYEKRPERLGDEQNRFLFKGHEFHHWDCTDNGSDCIARKPSTGKNYDCIQYGRNYIAGFPHFYYYSNPKAISRFVEFAREYRAKRLSKKHWDSIAKPLDSLGCFEEMVCKINGLSQNEKRTSLGKGAVVCLCADHGVVAEGVTQTDNSVTKVVAENFAKGASSVNLLQDAFDVYAVDMGMDCEPYPEKRLVLGSVVDRKVRRVSGNLRVEPAMTESECDMAIQVGKSIARNLKKKGYDLIACGEMGIGNTTPTSVLAALLLHKNAEEVTGRGAGLSNEGLELKIRVVQDAVDRIRRECAKSAGPECSKTAGPECSKTAGQAEIDCDLAFEYLRQGGGLEIAAMVGIYLGAATCRIPVIMDGIISTVAALLASKLDARVLDVIFASHESGDGAAKEILEQLEQTAVIHANMRAGEGCGAVLLYPLLERCYRVYEKMGSFEDLAIDAYERYV